MTEGAVQKRKLMGLGELDVYEDNSLGDPTTNNLGFKI